MQIARCAKRKQPSIKLLNITGRSGYLSTITRYSCVLNTNEEGVRIRRQCGMRITLQNGGRFVVPV
jgi:hypothetical protein